MCKYCEGTTPIAEWGETRAYVDECGTGGVFTDDGAGGRKCPGIK